MKFIADLHIHSKYSRATAKNLDLENIYMAAQIKGISVVGTGDFTHPAWFDEISSKLEPAEPGLFRLKPEIEKSLIDQVPASCRRDVRFILVSEISNIYKKEGRVRKNHNLVFAPDLETAGKFNQRLDKIGNIKSDGRPILGLDARDLLEILLETSDQNFLIPAHIWTPWFSMLGSKSGFDSPAECFSDLKDHIFAVETGLSSDPLMNWRVSCLDGLTLVSNSDAHSPMNLGREANIFDTNLSYFDMRNAMQNPTSGKFLGTFEFYPEEGKYHLDGHRKCEVRLFPKQTIDNDGICPKCHKPMTLGVLYRVDELADRPEGEKPSVTHPYYSLIPLADILSEIYQVGPKSKKVIQNYHRLIEQVGSEFDILHKLPTDVLESTHIPLLGESIQRMRSGTLYIDAGYDGEFGKVKLFDPGEREKLLGQKSLFNIPEDIPKKSRSKTKSKSVKKKADTDAKVKDASLSGPVSILEALNDPQKEAVLFDQKAMLIMAGPGTGKTRTLTHKIAYLIEEKGVSPESILAVTFTKKASLEMQERLDHLLKHRFNLPSVSTFHALCHYILAQNESDHHSIVDEYERKRIVKDILENASGDFANTQFNLKTIMDAIALFKQNLLESNPELPGFQPIFADETFLTIFDQYEQYLSLYRLWDYEDLILKVVKHFESDGDSLKSFQQRFAWIFIDEYQDLNKGQYRLIRQLATESHHICAIGDPNQSIYGFRGSDYSYFNRFETDFPGARHLHLDQNYRSSETILEASYQVIQKTDQTGKRIYSGIQAAKTIQILQVQRPENEAYSIGRIIEKMIGGTGYQAIDSQRIDINDHTQNLSFSDFAVLYRTGGQAQVFANAFTDMGIPFQMASKESVYYRKGISELIAMLKLIHGWGCLFDCETVINVLPKNVLNSTFKVFKKWCFDHKYDLNQAHNVIRLKSVPELNRDSQLSLYDFFGAIDQVRTQTESMTISETLHFLMTEFFAKEMFTDPEMAGHLNQLIETAGLYRDPAKFLDEFSLMTDTDIYDQKAQKVALMTMHAAKGLEFPVVFIVGCEKGNIPYEHPAARNIGKDLKKNHESDVDEERRLFYVAMTRAKSDLFLSYCKTRKIYGKTDVREMSPFVGDIENHLKKHQEHYVNRQHKKQVQLTLF